MNITNLEDFQIANQIVQNSKEIAWVFNDTILVCITNFESGVIYTEGRIGHGITVQQYVEDVTTLQNLFRHSYVQSLDFCDADEEILLEDIFFEEINNLEGVLK